MAREIAGRRQELAARAPDHAHRLVEEQDQAEGRQHLGQMIAVIERAQRHDLEHDADDHRGRNGDDDRQDERARPLIDGRGEIGPQHVKRAVGQVHHVHDPEHERQPGRDEEEEDAELNAVQRLFEYE